jgi:hypothetical protein
MKKLISVLVILCWLTPPAKSQQPRPKMQGVLEAAKIGFITQRLQLTPEEAQKFWPIYNLYSTEVRQAYIVYRNDRNELELEEALLNIRKKYSLEFHKAIDPGKINDFFRAEKDFNAIIQRELNRRQQMPNRFPPGP